MKVGPDLDGVGVDRAGDRRARRRVHDHRHHQESRWRPGERNDDELLPVGEQHARCVRCPAVGTRRERARGVAEETGSVSVVIPASQATGNYYLIAKADNGSVVTELLETNNTKVKSIKVNP